MEAARIPEDLFFAGALIYKTNKDGSPEPTWMYRVGPFQRAVAASGMSLADIERRAWPAEKSKGGYLSRVLGTRRRAGTKKSNGTVYEGNFARTMSYDNAVRIARALDLDFVEWEL